MWLVERFVMDLTSVRLLLILGLVVAAQAQNCERPVPGANMVLKDDFILLETFLNGAVASFRCDVGYTSAGGSSSVTCGDGSWSPVKLKCQRKSCGSAGEVDHGSVDYPEGNEFGDRAVVSCNRGYNMVGGAPRFCGDQGWTGRLPTCQAINCDPPREIQNGNFLPKKEDFYGFSEVVQYTCQKPYSRKGSKSLTCSETGEFKPDPPECIIVNCEEPVVKNGKWVSGSRPPHKHLASVTFECDTGYDMVGERTQTCDINEKWSPGLPKCIQKAVAATTKATTTTTTSTTTTTTPSGKQTAAPKSTDAPDSGSDGSGWKWGLGIFGGICCICCCIGGGICYKKKKSPMRSSPDNEAPKQGEDIPLSK
ncbi:membrane cofactor protein-like [Limanda limanda]|uniref:membrane cofactor protein-like n=1 Tax=Limanda limanda TaxID=27771 RepID=UPI0029C7366A|nr:membrane cofactor protein-like [Limanda limanda]